MKVFTKSKMLTLLVFAGVCVAQAQFRVLSNGNFYAKENTVVYSNENTTNDGILSFEKSSKLIVDKNFTNNSSNLTTLPTIGTPAFYMAKATLQVGSGSSNSGVAQTLQFKDFPTWTPGSPVSNFANNVHTPIVGFDQILHLIVNKTGSDVSVTRGSLHLTSLSPSTAGDGLSTLSVLTPSTLNANNRITMRSSSVENTAVVATSNPSAIVSNINVERYIPRNPTWNSSSSPTKGRAWRLLSPTTTGGTINSNWQEGASNPTHLPATDPTWGPTSNATTGINNNPYPGYGTHITSGEGLATGTDSQPSQNASLFAFNNNTQLWSAVTNTIGTNFTAGNPYRILVRGTRSNNLNFNNSVAENTILRTKGSLRFGTFSNTVNASAPNAFIFLGNAFQSAVDMNAATKVNVKNNAMRVWDPTLNVVGAWTTVDLANNVATGGSAMNRYLQPGQAYVVEAQTAGNVSVSFDESHRITNQDLVSVFSTGYLNRLDVRLYSQNDYINNQSASAGIFIDFNENGNNNYDMTDIGHSNNIDETLASVTNDNVHSSMQNRNLPEADEIVKLDVTRYRGQDYTFRLFLDNHLGRDAYLKDNFTNTETPIVPGEVVLYNFNVNNQIAASITPNRFDVIFKNNLSTELPFGSNFALYPNPNNTDKFFISTQGMVGNNVKISIVNMLGQTINIFSTTVPVDGIVEVKSAHLTEGVYSITLSDDNNQNYTTKLIKNN